MVTRWNSFVLGLIVSCAFTYLSAQVPVITGNTAPSENFINEEFCFSVTLEEGLGTGYGPYLRIFLPPGVDLNSVSFASTGTLTLQGVSTGTAINDPNHDFGTPNDSVTIPVGWSFYTFDYPVGSVTAGGVPLETEVCLQFDPGVVPLGTPQDIQFQTGYIFGDTPTGDNGPTLGPLQTTMITPTLYLFEKEYLTLPKYDRTPGPSWPLTYQLQADVADGMTVTSLVYTDILPDSLVYLPGSAVAPPGCTIDTSGIVPLVPGGTITVTCPSATGILGGPDNIVTYQGYLVDVLDETIAGGLCDEHLVLNNANFDTNEGAAVIDPDTVIAFNLTFQHGMNPGSIIPGATVNHSIAIQVSDFITEVDSFVMEVVIDDGLDYLGNAVFDGNAIVPVSSTVVAGVTTNVYHLIASSGPLLPGTAHTLTFDTRVRQVYQATGNPVLARDVLGAIANGFYHLSDESPGLVGCQYSCPASVSVLPVVVDKQVIGAANYVPGDSVTYRLSMAIPSGDADAVSFIDYLPLPIHDVNSLNLTFGGASIFPGPAHNGQIPLNITTIPANNALVIDWGDVNTANPPETLQVDIRVGITTIPYADALFHSNFLEARSDNTVINTADDLELTLIQVAAPDLSLVKGVASTSNPNVNISPPPSPVVDGDASDADAGDTIRYVSQITNIGGATAYDVKFADVTPAGMASCMLDSVRNGAGLPFAFPLGGSLFTSATDTLVLDSLTAGTPDTVAFVYYSCIVDSLVGPDVEIVNTGSAIWSSAPGQSATFTPVEDESRVTTASPSTTKSILSIAPGYSNQLTEATIGEVIAYKATLILPEGAVDSLRMIDVVDAGLAIVGVDSIVANPLIQSSLGPIAGLTAVLDSVGVGEENYDRELTVNFGNVTNSDRNDTIPDSICVFYRVVVANTFANQQGTTLGNGVTFSWNAPGQTNGASVSDQAPDVEIVEPDLQVQKTFFTNPLEVGDSVFVLLNVSHTGTSDATAYDVVLQDTLPFGLNFLPGSFSLACPAGVTTGPSFNSGVVRVGWDSLALGQSCEIRFKVQVDQAFPSCDSIVNCAQLTWETLSDSDQVTLPMAPSNPFGVERTGRDTLDAGQENNYRNESCDTLQITNGLAVDPVITGTSPVCEGDPAVISVQSYTGNIVVYNWSGPGVPANFNSNVLTIDPVTLADSGSYSIFVEVDGCRSDTSQQYQLQVEEQPLAAPTNDGQTCSPAGRDLNLAANASGGTPSYTYTWTGPGGFTSNVANPILPNVTNSNNGYYQVTVTDSLGCSSVTNSTLVSVTTQPNQPLITSSGPTCEGGSITLNTSLYSGSVVSYQWFRDGIALSQSGNSFTLNPVTLADVGNYSVVVTVDSCASDTSATVPVVVYPNPAPPAPTANAPVCAGQTIQLTANPPAGTFTYQWTGPNGFSSTAPNPSLPNASPAEQGTYSVTITSAQGCPNAGAVQVAVINQPAAPTVTASSPVCAGDQIVLTSPAYSGTNLLYIWTLPNASLDTTSVPQLVISPATLGDSGAYGLRIEVDGCPSPVAAPVTVSVLPVPQVAAAANSPVCEGEAINLSATTTTSGTLNYSWTGPGGFTSNQPNPSIFDVSVANTGIYTVTIGGTGNVCTSSDTVAVTVNPRPLTPSITAPSNLCVGDPLVLSTSSSCGTYQWIGPG
ncbi:MAG: hypothetical protein AAF998_26750, partial [Bacteroidota bacterium]